MYKGTYFILEDGARTFTRPSPLESYIAYVTLCASAGCRLRHKATGVIAYSVTILEDQVNQWEEIGANLNK